MTDLISRQAAIDSIQYAGKIGKQTCIAILKRLPSAQPNTKTVTPKEFVEEISPVGESMAKLEIPVKVDLDEIDKLIDELRNLQIYTLYERADQKLVDRDEVVKIFAGHIKAERRTDENPDIS